jgi:hypothetical protein
LSNIPHCPADPQAALHPSDIFAFSFQRSYRPNYFIQLKTSRQNKIHGEEAAKIIHTSEQSSVVLLSPSKQSEAFKAARLAVSVGL